MDNNKQKEVVFLEFTDDRFKEIITDKLHIINLKYLNKYNMNSNNIVKNIDIKLYNRKVIKEKMYNTI